MQSMHGFRVHRSNSGIAGIMQSVHAGVFDLRIPGYPDIAFTYPPEGIQLQGYDKSRCFGLGIWSYHLSHHHSHNHGRHPHSPVADSSDLVKSAFLLNLFFVVVEIVGGLLSNSIAILSDALHDLGDSLALGFSWWLEKYSSGEATERFTYGYRRFSLVGALVNAVILLTGCCIILWHAVPRVFNPEPASSTGMIAIAIAGIVVNGLAAYRLAGGRSENLRILSWHLIEDVLGWVAVLGGGLAIHYTGYYAIDPLLSIAISLFIIWNVVRRLRSTVDILLQGTPAGLPVSTIVTDLENIQGVIGQHHTHVWSLDGERHVLTTHLELDPAAPADRRVIKKRVREIADRFDFYHVTVEFDTPDELCSVASLSASNTHSDERE